MRKVDPRNINIYLADESSVNRKLDTIIRLLMASRVREQKMVVEIETLLTEVAEQETASGSLIVLTQGLKAKLDAIVSSAKDLEELKAAVSQAANALDTNEKKIVEAVVANTVAEDEEPPVE